MTTPPGPYDAVPPPPAQPAVPPRNGFGITALCLAIPGILFGFMPITGFIGVILGVLGLIFGLLGVARARKGVADNPKMSWIATGLALVSLVLGIIAMVLLFRITNDFVNDMNELSGQGVPPAAPARPIDPAAPVPIAPAAPVPIEPKAGPEYDSGSGEGNGPDIPPVVPMKPTEPAPVPQEPLTAPAAEQVTVEITGDVDEATIDYYVGMDMGSTTESLPYTYTGTSAGSPASVMVSTSIPMDMDSPTPSGTITCRILVGGEVVDENSASGEAPMVTCTEPGGY